MYNPQSFRIDDRAKIHDFIHENGFAILVTHGRDGMTATHLPLLLDADAGPNGTLVGHLARANPQWRDIQGEALAIFPGPHVYVSPTWYDTPAMVPTWNYVTVHAYGPIELVEDRAALHDIVGRLTARHEQGRPAPWSYDPTDPAMEAMLRAIVGFRIPIGRLEGKAKLNQNHPEARRLKVIRALEEQGDEASTAIAGRMAATLDAGSPP